ncbi:MAG: type II toxin-antitoxin system prevent-host-death family antitoxin [Anaerolineales bacterium]|nr:type II toxin-antitoxin system prevent-host-death family antitoxin [Anaerolineales bacterium]
MLTPVNITELRRNLSTYMHRVDHGESFLVTAHGKVVARLLPQDDPAGAAYQRILEVRSQAWVGDVESPLDEEWRADSEHL